MVVVGTIPGVPTDVDRPTGPPDGSVDHRTEPAGPPQAPLPRGVWAAAGALVALELAVSARYGFHRDELYFIAAGRHPALGYVDQPPVAPLLTRLGTALSSTVPTGVRLLPALVGGSVVVGTGLVTRVLGGARFAQVLAATAMACAPVLLGSAHLAGTTVYDLAAWTFTLWFVLRSVVLSQPRCWVWAGVVAGVGLETKDLILLLGASLAVGLVVTPTRRVLASRWPWLGAAVALVLWAPNLAWQAANGAPSLAMARSLRIEHSGAGDYVGFVPAQVILVGVLAFPIVVAGVRHLARRTDLRFVLVAVAVVVGYVFAVIPGREYYTAGMLPVLFAAGACRVEQRRTDRRGRRRWLAAPVVGAALTVAFVLPVLPLSTFARMTFLHTTSYDLGETVGWPQLTDRVAAVYDGLATPVRRDTAVFTSNYGEAGALALYGPALGLPAPLSGHNSYWRWGPGDAPDQTVVAVGSVGQLRPHFAACRYDTTYRSPDGVDDDEDGTAVWTCTGPRGPWSSFWAGLRHYG